MAKDIIDVLESAEAARSICQGAKAGRYVFDEHIVTGQTHGRIVLSIDVAHLVLAYLRDLRDQNPGRMLRLADHLRGKPRRNFPWRHRQQLTEDLEALAGRLKAGGYG
jgi:selenophosphate synthetase-related protein